jgi:class 3 adenylate cyclase
LFTDLVGSTQILDRLGDRAGEELMRGHFDMLRKSIALTDGHVVKTLGDGIMGIFRRPSDGVACAAAMQHGVTRHNVANPDVSLAMRVGVHCGPAIRMAGDYYGIPVIIAKRLCDHCTGGQVIVSSALRQQVALDPEMDFDELGGLTFKGLTEAVPAVELRWERRAPSWARGRHSHQTRAISTPPAGVLCGRTEQ